MKRYILILTFCMAFMPFVGAQSLEKAQKQMDKFNYAEAIDILKKDITDKKLRNDAIPMLAECYRLQRDIINTRKMYEKAVALPGAKPMSFFYFAQALQSTGDYLKAREIFLKYAEMNPSDPRGQLFVAHCDSVLGPWKEKTPDFEVKIVNNINTNQSDFGPAIYEDELIFASDYSSNPGEGKEYGWTGRGFLNIMKSQPVKSGDFYGRMGSRSEFDSKFNQAYHDGPAAFSNDGNSIYFTRSFYGKTKREGTFRTNQLKIFFSTKTDGHWGEVMPFYLNSTDYSVGHPTLSVDQQTLYFVSDMAGGNGGTDIWMCKNEGDAWGNPINLGPIINTPEDEMFPSIRDDGTLYFASEGHPGYGGLDIFKSTFANGTWSAPVNIQPPINGSFDDFAIAFAPGNKNGFFSSNRLGGVGNDDIYAFRNIEQPLPVLLPAYISGLVKDRNTMQPMAGATVFLLNPITEKVKVLKTDQDGMYKTTVKTPADYTVKAMMHSYIADCSPFEIEEVIPGITINAPRDLVLDKLVINKAFRIDNIYYDFDKYTIRDDAKPELDKLVRIMEENTIDVELGSHTDCRGSDRYNDKLSQKRAESAVKYIISAGIDESRIKARGYGESQLTNKCADGIDCTPEEHQANRRTEFKTTSYVIPEVNSEYDLDKFSAEEEIPLYMFEKKFFADCLKDKLLATIHSVSDNRIVSVPVESDEKSVSTENNGKMNAKNNMQSNSASVTYRVNLYSLSRKISVKDKEFNGLDNVQMYIENGMYKYTSGIFNTHEEASEYQKEMFKAGFVGAFIVVFADGKRIK